MSILPEQEAVLPVVCVIKSVVRFAQEERALDTMTGYLPRWQIIAEYIANGFQQSRSHIRQAVCAQKDALRSEQVAARPAEFINVWFEQDIAALPSQ